MKSKENNNVLSSNKIPSFEIEKNKENIFFDKLFTKISEYKEIDKDLFFPFLKILLKSFFSQKKRLITKIESCQQYLIKNRANLDINLDINNLCYFLFYIFKEKRITDLYLYLIEKIFDLEKIGIDIKEEEIIKLDIEAAFHFINDRLFLELFKNISVSFMDNDDYRKNIIFKINDIFFQLKNITDFDSKISNLKGILIKKNFVEFGLNFKENVMDYFLKNFIYKIKDISELINVMGREEKMSSKDIEKISDLIINIFLLMQKEIVKSEVFSKMKEQVKEQVKKDDLIIFNDYL